MDCEFIRDYPKEAFARLEQLHRKGTVTDDKAELASYREEKIDKCNNVME